ncbi:MAG: hypothetical protein HFG49_13275 [Lachnospiraceae bacterium]|jgi:hypothetical protein|nr:hypothetical protein [Lachnospiraceae bacterium]
MNVMNAKTMEGLAGASTSISMISTPMNIAKEAERKGDLDKMQRALGYASGLTEQAEEYSKKTKEGMKLDAEKADEQEKLQQKELIEARREEQNQQEQKIESQRQKEPDFDSAKISEEGKKQIEQSSSLTSFVSADILQNAVYDKLGETEGPSQEAGENIDISI